MSYTVQYRNENDERDVWQTGVGNVMQSVLDCEMCTDCDPAFIQAQDDDDMWHWVDSTGRHEHIVPTTNGEPV